MFDDHIYVGYRLEAEKPAAEAEILLTCQALLKQPPSSSSSWFRVALLLVPGAAGFLLGQAVDYATQLAWRFRSTPPVATHEGERKEPGPWRKALAAPADRLLHDGPATWDRTWKHIRRTEPYVYVRVTTKGGREIVGTVGDVSRIALSPQPRDLYIQEVLRPADDGALYPTKFGLGAFVAGSEIETGEWVSHKGVVSNARSATHADQQA